MDKEEFCHNPEENDSKIIPHGIHQMDQDRTILLIDDDTSLHQLVSKFLTQTNYRCLSAYSGQEGLRMILEQKPDLILLDYMMNDMTGDQVFQEFRANPNYESLRTTPVVILSAKENDLFTRTKLIKDGIQAYLNKPFGLPELKNIIENIFITHEIRLKNIELRQEVVETKEHLELLIDNAPIGILSTDINGNVVKINPFLINILGIPDAAQLLGSNIIRDNLYGDESLVENFKSILSEGIQVSLNAFEYRAPSGEWLKLNLKGVPLKNARGEISGLTLLVQDITQLEKKAYELGILRQIGVAMQSTLKQNEILHLILTTITAGCALGFSRAVLFMLNDDNSKLVGRMGVGPNTGEEAGRIWGQLSKEKLSFQNFLEKYGRQVPSEDDLFNQRIRNTEITLNEDPCLITQAVSQKVPIKATRETRNKARCQHCYKCIDAEEFVVVPLIVKDKVIGVILADNMFNPNPISEDMIDLLFLFTSQAAVAIERARAYRILEEENLKLEQTLKKLKRAQEQLLQNERLVTIGQMAAQVAHEIRNPLVTIGGFARTLTKSEKVNTDEDLTLMTQIIAEEVSRLERILNNVLDFVKLAKPEFQTVDINKIMLESLLMVSDSITQKSVTLQKSLDLDLAPIKIDPQQFKQVLINVLQNALYSMGNGGELFVRTFKRDDEHVVVQVEDTGEGIEEEVLENMFNPFFTTKPNGTGLGLPITQQIIHGHGGKIDVQSKVGKGTIFSFILPLN